LAGFVRSTERVGGFGDKAGILAMNEVFPGSPEFYQTLLKYQRAATVRAVRRAAGHLTVLPGFPSDNLDRA
jgi:hypothetical protein